MTTLSTATQDADPVRSAVRDRVVARVADVLGCAPADVDPAAGLAELGLGSVQVLALCGDLEDEFGVDVDPALVVDHPTPVALADHLAALGAQVAS
ncbi:acyl carrier protein [Cellulosimicrobium terreum]|nr:acyl carrier protein [Cellulosimicrobium terreum]